MATYSDRDMEIPKKRTSTMKRSEYKHRKPTKQERRDLKKFREKVFGF